MQNKNLPLYEIVAVIIGEAAVSLAVCVIFAIIGKGVLDTSVILGSLLGVGITVLNFLILSVLTNRAVNRALADRGDGEMDDEAAKEFAAKHQARLQLSMTVSYVIRIASMVAVLVVAFIFKDIFNVVATIVPIFLLRPIITVTQIIINRREKKNG